MEVTTFHLINAADAVLFFGEKGQGVARTTGSSSLECELVV
jgi:hypothetical protein